ncbi:MAG TPA: hypothetical protein VM182_17345 [Terriglobia bacterium]|nr:hypothetical protein [Terriglobia bacterium]
MIYETDEDASVCFTAAELLTAIGDFDGAVVVTMDGTPAYPFRICSAETVASYLAQAVDFELTLRTAEEEDED